MSTLPRSVDLLLATGGTGGHIYPALAVARAARARDLTVAFLGQEGGMEARLVPEAGFPFLGVAAGKWDRQRPDPRQAFRALNGLLAAVRAVRAASPRLVVGFGGFASFPGCAAAVLTGTPLALHEGNAFPSRVNRWFAPRARLVVSAQEAAGRHLRCRALAVVPFPVRETRVERAAARKALGLAPDAVVTLVMGGSQGSAALNRAVPDAYRKLRGPGLQVLHSSGPRWFDRLRASVVDLPDYHVRPYLDAAEAFAAADLAITRAGVGTISEAAFHGVPLVMVPLPSAAEDHQRHNAEAVEAAGAGCVVLEADLDRLADAWRSLLDPARRAAAAEAAARRSPAGAADRIVDALLPHRSPDPRPAGSMQGGVL
ncbi:MAG: undecaprenyldiphospho-muramoylpentapeptide beta-N-acetylglucosaminyltransferase [Deinococcales bacterium]